MLSFFYFYLIAFPSVINMVLGVEFKLTNNGRDKIWAGIQGNPGHEHLNGGGLVLNPGQTVPVQAAANWAGRFWGRTGCNSDTNHCETGDCGNKLQCNGTGGTPPATLAEITLKGSGGLDFYDISLVDGFNIMLEIKPINGQGDNSQYSCKKSGCQKNLNSNCPSALKYANGTACNSACNAFSTDEYCCRGPHGTPETCVSSTWPVNYPKFFKDNCPDAYSYAYDDHKSTFTCKAEVYQITFG